MGKGDNRITKELDPKQLAELAKAASDDHAAPVLGRTKTIDDPMTTALLAEVAQRSKTADFDQEVVEDLLDEVHPRLRRRKS